MTRIFTFYYIFFMISKIYCNKAKYYIILIYLIQVILVILGMNSKLGHWLFYISPFFRSLNFLMGMLLGKIIKSRDKYSNNKTYSYLEMILVFIFLGIYYMAKYIPTIFRWGVYYSPIIIIILYIFYFEKGIFSKILSGKLFCKLATISFEFYMIHQLIIIKINTYINNDIVCILISLILSLISAVILKKFITELSKLL